MVDKTFFGAENGRYLFVFPKDYQFYFVFLQAI